MLEKVVLVGLAAWRLAAMLSYERGPGDVFLRFREALGFEHSENGEPIVWPDSFLPKLVSCVWCLGVYSALLVWGIWVLEPALVYILAAMSIVVAMEKVARG